MDGVLQQIVQLAQQYPAIQKLVLFGSRARGDAAAGSDYDIAVFPASADFTDELQLRNDIDELDTLYKIDLVVVDAAIDAVLLENINREGIVLMERENKRLNFKNAVARLGEALAECQNAPTALMKDGAIQRFEFTAELAWKACREYLMQLGYPDVNGPKPVMKEALSHGIIQDGEGWMNLLNDRNLTSHVYKEDLAEAIYQRIVSKHYALLEQLAAYFEGQE